MQILIYCKNLWKCIFTVSMAVSVSHFLKVGLDHGDSAPRPFRIFVDHVTIFSSNTM